MSEERQYDEVLERRFDWALREVTGGERAPDVTEVVMARAAAGEVVEVGLAKEPKNMRGLLVAALLLIGISVVVGVLMLEGDQDATAVGGVPLAPLPRADEPDWIVITDPGVIAELSPDLVAVEVRNFDDSGLAALVARCPRLRALRVFASTAYRKPGDVGPPMSITDAALADIAGLVELRWLELVGTNAVEGSGLRQLDALPVLETLALSWFDVPGAALRVLPRLPSLRDLNLRCNHTVGKAGCEAIADCPGLRKLQLTTKFLGVDSFAALQRLTGLVELRLWGGYRAETRGLSAADLEALEAQLAAAKELGTGLKVAGLRGWPNLRALDLRINSELEPEVGELLRKQCPELREVRVGYCYRVDDVTVAELIGLRWLHTLDLSECWRVSEHSLPLLLAARQLRDIRLDGLKWMTLGIAEQLILGGKRPVCRLAPGTSAGDGMPAEQFNAGMKALTKRYEDLLAQPNTYLVQRAKDFAELPASARRIHVEGQFSVPSGALERFEELQELQVVGAVTFDSGSRGAILARAGLRRLELDGCVELPSSWLARLGGLRDLEALSLVGLDGVDGAVVQGLKALTGLRELSLRRCSLGSAALRPLAGMRLRKLRLDQNQPLDSSGLEQVPVTLEELGLAGCSNLDGSAARLLRDRFPGLQVLDLSNCQWLTDEALAMVLQLPRLQRLDVHGCSSLTPDLVARLRATLPKLDLRYDGR